jgi:hypothetical protein
MLQRALCMLIASVHRSTAQCQQPVQQQVYKCKIDDDHNAGRRTLGLAVAAVACFTEAFLSFLSSGSDSDSDSDEPDPALLQWSVTFQHIKTFDEWPSVSNSFASDTVWLLAIVRHSCNACITHQSCTSKLTTTLFHC